MTIYGERPDKWFCFDEKARQWGTPNGKCGILFHLQFS